MQEKATKSHQSQNRLQQRVDSFLNLTVKSFFVFQSVLPAINTKEIMINHKGTRMVKDREDWHGLQATFEIEKFS